MTDRELVLCRCDNVYVSRRLEREYVDGTTNEKLVGNCPACGDSANGSARTVPEDLIP